MLEIVLFIFGGGGAHPASGTMVAGSIPVAKQPELGSDHLTPSSAEVEERVELWKTCEMLLWSTALLNYWNEWHVTINAMLE